MATVNYPYYSPQPQQMMMPPQYSMQRQTYVEQPQIGIKGRPVASIDEVRATSIDFDGSIFYFPDLANKCIYTKQINLDGTSTLNVYELKNVPVETPINTSQFITREEFENTINQLLASIQQKPTEEVKKEEEPTKFSF